MDAFYPFLILIAAFITAYTIILPVILSYSILGDQIKVSYFRFFTVARIEFKNIQEIKICKSWDDSLNAYNFRTQRLGNRLSKECIAIEVK